MSIPFKVVIPARYASSRLPGKPLLDLGGKPMVVRVAQRAQAAGADEIIVACDHPDVFAAVEAHGFRACMTRTDHATGTDRIAEIVHKENWHDDTAVVNLQGDEPLIEPGLINRLAERLATSQADIVTAAHRIDDAAHFFNPNVVKVVCRTDGEALYFSRAPIPWARDDFADETGKTRLTFTALRHIGIYAFRCAFLKIYPGLPVSALEQIEALEQLRALAQGYRIQVIEEASAPPGGVDTAEDAARVARWFDSAKFPSPTRD